MLLEDVKNHLRVTWDDEDVEITKLIERAKKYIDRLIGVSLDYEVEDTPKILLLNYCRYSRNNSVEYFKENFHDDILQLQLEEAIKKQGEQNETTQA
ncbi:head-tail connector protein [Senegalia massiliensis]|uniref:head-tail connector protein n=1 Tax=Senegalia massiliensis TaxID=1720316 RepID=UPI001030B17C|nr:head-tail connector protein [Senegalia massiliensis]